MINLYNLRDGTPYFAPIGPTEYTTDPNQPMFNSPLSLAVADLNGDGKPDVVTADSGDDTVGVFLNSTVKPSLALRVLSTTFNGTVIDGAWSPGTVSLALTNTSSHTWITGIAGIEVFACANGVIDPDQDGIANANSVSLNIGPRQSITLQLPTDLSVNFPLSIGTYTLLAEVTDPYGNTIDETSGPKLKVVPLAPILPPPDPADTFSQVIGSAHGVTVPLIWETAGLGVGPSLYKSEVLLTGGTGTVYSNANGGFDLQLKGNCSLSIVSAVPQYEFPNLDLGTVDVKGSLVRLNAASSNVTGTVRVTGSIGTAILKDITGNLLVSGSIGNLRAQQMSGDISAGANIGSLQLLQVSGTIAAGRRLGSLAAMSLTNARVIAGATVADTGALDNPAPGFIRSLQISGAVAQSFIGAGVNPQDGLYGNGNDTRFPTGPNEIFSLTATSIDAASTLEAATFHAVRIDQKLISTDDDPRVHLLAQ